MNTSATPRPQTKDETVTTAQEYAAIIAEEIRALETALDGPGRYYDAANPAEDDDTDTEYRAALDVLEYPHDIEQTDILYTYETETILEITLWHGSNGTTRTEWLRTYGGPTCRVLFDGGDYVDIVTTGGTDSSTAQISIYCPTLANMVNEIGESCRA